MLLIALLACTDKTTNPGTDDTSGGGSDVLVTQVSERSGVLDAAPSTDGVVFVDGDAVYLAPDTKLADLPGAMSVTMDPFTNNIYVVDGATGWKIPLGGGAPEELRGLYSVEPTAVAMQGSSLLVGGLRDDVIPAVFAYDPETSFEPELLGEVGDEPITALAVSADGDIYAAGSTSVWRVPGGSPVISDVSLGSPAGIALTGDGSGLMMSSLSDSGSAQVLIFNLSDGSTSTFDQGISQNSQPGGLHQVASFPIYTWADRQAGVYRIEMY